MLIISDFWEEADELRPFRARGRTVKKFLARLTLAHEVTFPTEVQHLSESLQMRHSEPCTLGGLKSTHQAFVFMEEIAAVEVKLTDTSLYNVLYKELLSSTLTGVNQTQAPRIPAVMVQALEDTVVDESVRFYFRVPWSHPRQEVRSVGELTNDTSHEIQDHWIRQDSVELECRGPTCFVKRSEWLSCGWALLKQQADYPRDYFLPMPSGSYKGGVHRELRYDTAPALQTKVLQSLKVRRELLLSQRTAQYWTPHSGLNFLVSAASAVGVSNIRVSRSRIANVQQQVVSALTNHQEPDPLCEEEALQDFSVFLDSHVSEGEKKRCLGQRTYVGQPREPQTPHEEQPGDLVQLPSEQLLLEEEEHEYRWQRRQRQGRRSRCGTMSERRSWERIHENSGGSCGSR